MAARAAFLAVCLLGLSAFAFGKVYFQEKFDGMCLVVREGLVILNGRDL